MLVEKEEKRCPRGEDMDKQGTENAERQFIE